MEDEKEKTAVEPAAAAETPKPAAPKVRTELKVSIIIKGGKIFMAAQATDTDPKMTTLTGDLDAALARARTFVDECNAAWDIAPKNPEAPKPPPPPAPVRTATTGSTASKGKSTKPAAAAPPAAPKAQPRFF
jgi:septal ring-binding cell division protein DamX